MKYTSRSRTVGSKNYLQEAIKTVAQANDLIVDLLDMIEHKHIPKGVWLAATTVTLRENLDALQKFARAGRIRNAKRQSQVGRGEHGCIIRDKQG